MKPAPSLAAPIPVAVGEPKKLKPAKPARNVASKKQNQVLPVVAAPKPTVSFYETAYYWLMSR